MPLSQNEVSALEFIFNLKSKQRSKVSVDEFVSLVRQLYHGREYKDIIQEIVELATSSGAEKELNLTKCIAYIEMIFLRQKPKFPIAISIHQVLESQRLQCLTEKGNYIEAGKVHEQIKSLLESESARRQQVFISKQNYEMNSLKRAHDEQYIRFKEEWNIFFEELETKSTQSLNAMREQHSHSLDCYLKQLEKEAESKTPLWSKELKQFKKREQILAYQENYAEAHKVKVIVDALEKEEKDKAMAVSRDGTIARKETAFRQKQEAEVQVVMKRISAHKETSEKQRETDLKRLLQRNRNIQESLRSKQTLDSNQTSITKDIQKEIEALKVIMERHT